MYSALIAACIQVKVFVHCLQHHIIRIFFILVCRRHVYCQSQGSRSNVSQLAYVKDSHHTTAWELVWAVLEISGLRVADRHSNASTVCNRASRLVSE